MAANTTQICNILVSGQVDLAGKVVTSTGELQVIAATTGPTISAITADHNILANVYGEDVRNVKQCV